MKSGLSSLNDGKMNTGKQLHTLNEFLDFLCTTLINELIKFDNDVLNVCN